MRRLPQEKSPDELAEEQIAKLQQLKKDYVATFSTEAGKKVFADLEKTCFVNRTTFSTMAGRTLFNEGMRFVVVHIKNMMTMSIETIKKLIQKED